MAEKLPLDFGRYDAPLGPATSWLVTGDGRTGIPFLAISGGQVEYCRRYLPTTDGEAVALDVAFPEWGHSARLPMYLILHGLSGGSSEEFIKDFVSRRVGEGSTVVVMISRGMMQTPISKWNMFHGARISDVSQAAELLSRAKSENQILAGVGYSMGAVVLSNYVARSGPECALDAAVAISGGLDMRENINFERGKRLWQPLLVRELRELVIQMSNGRYEARLTREQQMAFHKATSIQELDEAFVVNYNNFTDLQHYYAEMSASGDVETPCNAESPRLSNVSIPFLVVHALDDPIITWKTLCRPQDVALSGNGFVMMLITRTGGHVGWPVGSNPTRGAWSWMNDVARDFANALAL